MTVGKQSNNKNEKVLFILVVQDLDRLTAATYDTSYNVEQHKGALTLFFGICPDLRCRRNSLTRGINMVQV